MFEPGSKSINKTNSSWITGLNFFSVIKRTFSVGNNTKDTGASSHLKDGCMFCCVTYETKEVFGVNVNRNLMKYYGKTKV